jgi:hypothetical protein
MNKSDFDKAMKEAAGKYESEGQGSLVETRAFKAGAQWATQYWRDLGAGEFDEEGLFKHHSEIENLTGNYASWSPFEMLKEGASWQHQQSFTTIAALKAENEKLKTENERYKNLDTDYGNMYRDYTNLINDGTDLYLKKENQTLKSERDRAVECLRDVLQKHDSHSQAYTEDIFPDDKREACQTTAGRMGRHMVKVYGEYLSKARACLERIEKGKA